MTIILVGRNLSTSRLHIQCRAGGLGRFFFYWLTEGRLFRWDTNRNLSETDQSSRAGLPPNAQYDLSLLGNQDSLPQPGSSSMTTSLGHQSYPRQLIAPQSPRTILDQDQASGVSSRPIPTLATTTLCDLNLSSREDVLCIDLATQQAQHDTGPRAASTSNGPTGLEETLIDQVEIARPSKISSINHCDCLKCLLVGAFDRSSYGPGQYICRFPDCKESRSWRSDRSSHEKQHFVCSGRYACNASDCTRSFKRWDDLVRHTTSEHCLNPVKYPCLVVGCRFGGENGFVRKDKLTSHRKNVHEGELVFTQAGAPRSIRPAVGGTSISTTSSGLFVEAQGQGTVGRGSRRVRRT